MPTTGTDTGSGCSVSGRSVWPCREDDRGQGNTLAVCSRCCMSGYGMLCVVSLYVLAIGWVRVSLPLLTCEILVDKMRYERCRAYEM